MFNLLRVFAVVAALFGVALDCAFAQTWPAKSLRVVVPLTAGSATDVIPRIVFEQVSAQIGQSMVVENRTGGGGTIGALAVARAEADGYTILVHSNAHTIAPAVHVNLGYDVVKDFAGITPLGNVPNVLVIAPSKGSSPSGNSSPGPRPRPGRPIMLRAVPARRRISPPSAFA